MCCIFRISFFEFQSSASFKVKPCIHDCVIIGGQLIHFLDFVVLNGKSGPSVHF